MTTTLQLPSPHQNRHKDLKPASTLRSDGDDHCRKGHRGELTRRGLPALLRWGLRLFPLVYGFGLELRSLRHRMGIRHKRRYEVSGLDLGPTHQTSTDGHLEVNTRTRACTQDIENFAERHPWATLVDVETYRDAWLAGAAWAESNSDSCKQVQEQSP